MIFLYFTVLFLGTVNFWSLSLPLHFYFTSHVEMHIVQVSCTCLRGWHDQFWVRVNPNPLQFYYKVKKMLTVVCISAFRYIVYEWVKNRIERQNILLQETRLSGMSREFGLLDKCGSKWGYYKRASFKGAYDILNHWSAQKGAPCSQDHLTLLKQKARKLPKNIEQRVYSNQQMCLIFNRE